VPTRGFPAALHALRRTGLHFNPRTCEGMIVLASNEMEPNSAELFTMARTATRIAEFEAAALQALMD
jgi:hypothetical protein